MTSSKNKVFALINRGGFALRGLSPQQKHQILLLLIENFHNSVSQLFPAVTSMTIGLSASNRQDSIQEQDSLVGPIFEVTVRRRIRNPHIGMSFLEDVNQRWRWFDAFLDGKGKPMSLSRSMVGICN